MSVRDNTKKNLYRKPSVEERLMHIIQERVEIEEAAYVGVKHDLAAKIG